VVELHLRPVNQFLIAGDATRTMITSIFIHDAVGAGERLLSRLDLSLSLGRLLLGENRINQVGLRD
jgi:hypothetical protein